MHHSSGIQLRSDGQWLIPMTEIELLNKNLEQAPENLVAFIDGQVLIPSDFSEAELKRPKKKRKVTGPKIPETLLHLNGLDYLTLARVDINMVRLNSSLTVSLG